MTNDKQYYYVNFHGYVSIEVPNGVDPKTAAIDKLMKGLEPWEDLDIEITKVTRNTENDY